MLSFFHHLHILLKDVQNRSQHGFFWWWCTQILIKIVLVALLDGDFHTTQKVEWSYKCSVKNSTPRTNTHYTKRALITYNGSITTGLDDHTWSAKLVCCPLASYFPVLVMASPPVSSIVNSSTQNIPAGMRNEPGRRHPPPQNGPSKGTRTCLRHGNVIALLD